MCEYIIAKPGHKFIITEKGKTDSRISDKFNPNNKRKNQYEFKAPSRWINEGYVVEVEI